MAKAKKTKSSKVVSKKAKNAKSPAKKAKPAKTAKKAKTTLKKKVASKKKAVAKKTVVKKSAAKKTVLKKTATKKPVVKKTVAKKTLAKKTAAKKAVAKNAVVVKKTVEKSLTKSLEQSLSPLDDRIVVRVEESEKVTAGGLYIPATVSDISGNLKGLVLAVGRGHMNKKGHVKPMDVQVGQTVLFADYSGTKFDHQGQDVIIIRESDILGIIEK